MKNWRWIMTDLAFGGQITVPIGGDPAVRCGEHDRVRNSFVSYPSISDPLGTTA